MSLNQMDDEAIYNPQHFILVVKNKLDGSCYCIPSLTHTARLNNTQDEIIAILPPILPENLGDTTFKDLHQLTYPYIVGEMANGIATAAMVITAAKSGVFGFFGAGGLMPDKIEDQLRTIQSALPDRKNWGSNLIHMPALPEMEAKIVDLYLNMGVTRVSASAYMSINKHIVRYAASGLELDKQGNIKRNNYIIAKISRPEVAQQFMSPAPAKILDALVAEGRITPQQAQIAGKIPLAQDVTVEADSGGHTDNRPLVALLPTIIALARKLERDHNYATPIRIGAAGGLGNPAGVAAAFTLGAAYVLTGSINAAAVESGLSETAKKMLASADIADVMMAPAADMFELGVKLQVLKRGTLFGPRALKLYELYRAYNSLDEIPEAEKTKLEQQIFLDKIENIRDATLDFFKTRDPKQIEKARINPKHLMALVFRWYLGQSSKWAITGDEKRQVDYQLWCGPAMGAFNIWVNGTPLEDLKQRTVTQIAKNLLYGATVLLRLEQLRNAGITIDPARYILKPRIMDN